MENSIRGLCTNTVMASGAWCLGIISLMAACIFGYIDISKVFIWHQMLCEVVPLIAPGTSKTCWGRVEYVWKTMLSRCQAHLGQARGSESFRLALSRGDHSDTAPMRNINWSLVYTFPIGPWGSLFVLGSWSWFSRSQSQRSNLVSGA